MCSCPWPSLPNLSEFGDEVWSIVNVMPPLLLRGFTLSLDCMHCSGLSGPVRRPYVFSFCFLNEKNLTEISNIFHGISYLTI